MRARLGRSAAIDSQNGVTTARQSGNLSLYFIQHIVCSAFSSSHHQFNENDRLGSSRKSTDSGDRLNHCRLRYLTILIAGFVSAHVFMVCDSPIMQAQVVAAGETIHPPDKKSSGEQSTTTSQGAIEFGKHIRPILSDTCYTCHGPDPEARSTDLRLDDRDSAMQSGILESGEMLRRILSENPDDQMPPPESNRPLTTGDRERLRSWLETGANWPEDDRHWAFIPPQRSVPPEIENQHSVQN
ncbi:hypothetical protein N9C08_04255, partial [Rubripirellula sp.]|nr:hypothetical protein [Rubripirellula sp.]